jgi:hypothetical protein
MAKKKASPVVEKLREASQGLLYPSETDAPFEPFEWPGEEGKPDKARVLELAGLPASTPTKAKSLDAFFRDVTEEQDWHDDEEKAQAAHVLQEDLHVLQRRILHERFKQLVGTLKEALKDVKVFLAGEAAESDAFIVGRSEAGWAGLKTRVVET